MTTLAEYADMLSFLVDETVEPQRAAEAYNAAVRASLPYVPKRDKVVLTGDGVTTSFQLPDDFYWIEAVFGDDGKRIPGLQPSQAEFIGSGNVWMLHPTGYISFLSPPTADVTVFYYATWPEFQDTQAVTGFEELSTPRYLLNALLFFGAAYILLPPTVSAAEIRQYATRIDSGTPEHNPVGAQARFFMSLFESEMRRFANGTLRVSL